MDTKRLYVDFHVLQTVPPSCVNRDDTGSPKTAVYGGAVRARVSSQAWKHAMRVMFTGEMSDAVETGYRTKKGMQSPCSGQGCPQTGPEGHCRCRHQER